MPANAIEGQPNIVLVHCHDLGRYLGCYDRPIETPRIDAIAEDGVRFDQYNATSPTCSPSRASMYTGLYPHNNGVMGLTHLGWDLNDDVDTLPEYLRSEGYDTHFFGTRHASKWPRRLGYDDFHGYDEQGEGVDKTFDRVDAFADSIEDFDAPYLATVGFNIPHAPFRKDVVDDDIYARYDADEMTVPEFLEDTPEIREDLAEFTPLVEHGLDPAVGALRDTIDDAGQTEDTLFIFTTDHGVDFPGAKNRGTDHGHGITLLMDHPDLESETNQQLLSNVDLLPTLHDIAGGEPDQALDGRTFLPALEDRPYQPREAVYGECTWHGGRPSPHRTIRTRQFRYTETFLTDNLRTESPEQALYDLEADPHETTNLASDQSRDMGPPVILEPDWLADASEPAPEYTDLRQSLQQQLHRWMQAENDPLLDGSLPLPDYERKRLEKD